MICIKDLCSLKNAFVTYVQPLVEYCSPVWSPSLIGLIDKVESVQRCFTKRLMGLKNTPYADCVSCLNSISLELRRLHADLCLCYKIIFGLNALDKTDFF